MGKLVIFLIALLAVLVAVRQYDEEEPATKTPFHVVETKRLLGIIPVSFPAPPPLTSGMPIVLYAYAGDVGGQVAELSLQFRGLPYKTVLFQNLDELLALNITGQLKKAGIATGSDGNETISFPFFTVNDDLWSYEQIKKSLAELPPTNVRESSAPYIVVYGVEGCPYSLSKVRELEENKLLYELRDVNDPHYQLRFQALLELNKVTHIDWPVVDVSGHLLVRPTLEEIRKYYQ